MPVVAVLLSATVWLQSQLTLKNIISLSDDHELQNYHFISEFQEAMDYFNITK